MSHMMTMRYVKITQNEPMINIFFFTIVFNYMNEGWVKLLRRRSRDLLCLSL